MRVYENPGKSKSEYKNVRFFNLILRDQNLYDAIVETSTPDSISVPSSFFIPIATYIWKQAPNEARGKGYMKTIQE